MTPEDAIERVQGLATDIYATLRGGYNESVYEEAMAVEFRAAGIPYDVQQTAEVMYKEHKVGEQALDFIVRVGGVVVELKAASALSKAHRAQLRAYLRTTGGDVGLLVNFSPDDKPAPDFEIIEMKV